MGDTRYLRTTSTNYKRPYRPVVVRAVNTLGGIGRSLGMTLNLTPAGLINAARRAMKLEDFGGVSGPSGEPDFLPGLEALMDSIAREARLTPFGRFVTRERVRNVLENRLRAQYWFSRFPSILADNVLPLTVITGLQRTGTTLLHRLLASDPEARSLLSWEAINPAPFLKGFREYSGAGKAGGDAFGAAGDDCFSAERMARIGKADLSQRVLSYIAPDFFTIHPVVAMAPEEDVLLLDYSFLSTVPEATLRVPSYSLWVEKQDQTPAYEYMKKLLKLLQWQKPASWWVLKTPHHLEYLDTLLTVFPGTKIIQTHRDPAVTLASFFSMVCHGRGIFSNAVDPKEVARQWGRKIGRIMDNAMASRRGRPEGDFLDISYTEFIREPMREIERVYEFLGRRLKGEAADAMRATLKESNRYKFGKHVYRLSDFGVTVHEIRERFKEYYETFGAYIFGEEEYEQAQA